MNRTERITCECRICKTNAAKIGQPFPLAAMCDPRALDAAKGKTHGLVHLAHDPQFKVVRDRLPAVPCA